MKYPRALRTKSFTLQIFRFAHLECSLIHHIFKEFESWGACDENSTNTALEYQGFSLPVMKYIEIHPRGVLNHVLRKESREPMELEATLVNMIMVWSGDESLMAYFCSWYVRKKVFILLTKEISIFTCFKISLRMQLPESFLARKGRQNH